MLTCCPQTAAKAAAKKSATKAKSTKAAASKPKDKPKKVCNLVSSSFEPC